MGQWLKIIPGHHLSDGNDKLKSMKYPGEETRNPVAVQSQLIYIYILLILEKSIRFERTANTPPVNPLIVSPLSIRNKYSTANITCIIIQIYLASEIVPKDEL